MALTAPTIEDRYQIVTKVASGGMGVVYRGHDPILLRDVAIKVLHPHLAGDRGFVDRFRREARAAGILNHPNIVGVYDWGSTDGTYFMVMEFVPGVNLRAVLTGARRLQPIQVVEVAIPVLRALEHAHKHGIVHRDIKPENILIAREGGVKVADFGLARAYADSSVSQTDGMVTGTVQYLAPEQIQGSPADPRTDLYALGIVMFEMLTGRAPFSGETSLAIAYKHLSTQVPPPSSVAPGIPPHLDQFVLWATARNRDARPPSARALGRELERAVRTLPRSPRVVEVASRTSPAEPPNDERATTVTIPRVAPPPPRRRRRGWVLVAALLAALALLGGTAWAAWAYLVPHYTRIPPVYGLTVQEAERRLEAAGLDPRNGAGVYSRTVPAGLIVLTEPPPGVRVEKGDEVVLVPSVGPELRLVPGVEGKREAAARKLLIRAGFEPRIRRAYDDEVPRGRVIRQSTEEGNRLERGAPVTITVSRGPAPIEIPELAGRLSSDAALTLETLGFEVAETEEYSVEVERGVVIRTEPDAGGKEVPGSTVTIVVSKGPREFAMPNVIGMPVDDAQAQLEGMGLQVKVIRLPGFRGTDVKLQRPDSGATVQQGEEVSIYA
ncbi:MAG TPA: Stk1 family PASTA domain-containing Ser/Thr kinase [Actinomycetota bacterium]|nr:Stk1 family PASTA domain-containing Ser/Thr kinase [Actinomycetota bacterium]